MRIESNRIGNIEVDESDFIVFPSGLVGLSQRKRFVLMEFERELPLGWLQSVDDPEFGLPVAEPGIFVQDYRVELPRREVQDLELRRPEDALFLIVTTIHAGGVMVTGNLRAPLLVDATTRRGVQIVLDRQDLDLRALVDPVAFARASGTSPVAKVGVEPAPREPVGS